MSDLEKDFADLLGRHLDQAGFTQQEFAKKIGMHRNTVVKWLNRTILRPSRGQVLRIADALFLSKEERKALIHAAGHSLERWPTEVWMVPQKQNMFFTGRDAVFQSLKSYFMPESPTSDLTQAISGLGGIGKTQMAVEYIYRYHKDYEAVLWLQAETWDALISACMRAAHELDILENKDAEQVIDAVQDWLRKHRNWLLILDNVEDPQEILTKFVPPGHQGCVLVTTRVHRIEPLARTHELTSLSEQDGILFLLRRTHKNALDADLQQASRTEQDEAQQIWHLMEGLPLALDQAGAYIFETGCSFLAYREQYNNRRRDLLNRRGKWFIGHDEAVATTFSLAFERVEALNPLAADTLRVCSLLYSKAIPEEIFREGAEYLGPHVAMEKDLWDLAVGVLQDYSLVQRHADTTSLAIHRLVQDVLQDAMSEQEHAMWIERVIAALYGVFPRVTYSVWKQCERLLPHALLFAAATLSNDLSRLRLAALLFKAAHYLFMRNQYGEAEALYQRVLSIREYDLGSDHLDVASALNALAELSRIQGRYGEAEALYLRALDIGKQIVQQKLSVGELAIGLHHHLIASVLNNLGINNKKQARYAEAESFYQQTLDAWTQIRGIEHPDLASPLNNLAAFYKELGKYREAEPLYLRALDIWQKAWGPDNPYVATALNNLGLLYAEQGDVAKAEPLYLEALRIREATLGPEDPLVATVLSNLGDLYAAQGDYVKAQPLYERARDIQEQTHGINHPDVVYSLLGLAILNKAQGHYAIAEPLYLRALRIRESVFGSHHPETADILQSLASFYHVQGTYDKAISFCKRALIIYERAFGVLHPKTVKTQRAYDTLQEKVEMPPDTD